MLHVCLLCCGWQVPNGPCKESPARSVPDEAGPCLGPLTELVPDDGPNEHFWMPGWRKIHGHVPRPLTRHGDGLWRREARVSLPADLHGHGFDIGGSVNVADVRQPDHDLLAGPARLFNADYSAVSPDLLT